MDSMQEAFLFVLVLLLTLTAQHAVVVHASKVPWLNTSSVCVLLGLTVGGILHVFQDRLNLQEAEFRFSEGMFWDVLVPPIIYSAGWHLRKRMFFVNFTTIVGLGIVGTLMTTALIALIAQYVLNNEFFLHGLGNAEGLQRLKPTHSLALGAIFSSTDSAAILAILSPEQYPFLNSLVFGEAVLNDATVIVLFRAIKAVFEGDDNAVDNDGEPVPGQAFSMVVLGTILRSFVVQYVVSTMIGVAAGLGSAYIVKRVDFAYQDVQGGNAPPQRAEDDDDDTRGLQRQPASENHSVDEASSREICVVMLVAYAAYCFASSAGFSGILCLFFCGIAQSHWTSWNLSIASRQAFGLLVRTASFLAEGITFLYCGIVVYGYQRAESAPLFAVGATLAMLASRAAYVFCFILFMNCFRSRKVTLKEQIVIWYSGIVRGAIAFALALETPRGAGVRGTFVSATLSCVIFSTVVLSAFQRTLMLRTVGSGEVDHSPVDLSGIYQLLRSHNLSGIGNLQAGSRGTSGRSSGRASPVTSRNANAEGGSTRSSRLGSSEDEEADMEAGDGNALQRSTSQPTSWIATTWSEFDRKHMQPVFGGLYNSREMRQRGER